MKKLDIKVRDAITTQSAKLRDKIEAAKSRKEIIDASEVTQLVEDMYGSGDIAGTLQKHIYAAMRRHDFQIADGEKLNDQSVIMREISRKTGYDLGTSLDKESIIAAMDRQAAAFLNRALGTEITSFTDQEQLREGLTQTIVQQIEGGGMGKVLADGKTNIIKIGNIALSPAFARLKATSIRDGHKKLMRRIYQKRYERTHIKVWD